MGEEGEPPVPTPREFDRMMDAKVLEWGSRKDRPCPKCGEVGFRVIADSEMVSLRACRKCGHQAEEFHEPRETVERPFREYREGRGVIANYEDGTEGAPR